MKEYYNFVVRFDNAPEVLVRSSTPERAVAHALDYHANSWSRAFTGKPVPTLENVVQVETENWAKRA